MNFFANFLMNFDAFYNGFWFYSILAGWWTWQWVFLNFSQSFWSFDNPDTLECASAVIWNRFEPFLLQWNRCWKFQLSNLKNKKVSFLKKHFLSRCLKLWSKRWIAVLIFSEGFAQVLLSVKQARLWACGCGDVSTPSFGSNLREHS